MRTDSLYVGTMRTSCVVAVLSVLGGLALFFVLKFREERVPKDLFAEEVTIPLGDESLYSEEDETAGDSADEEMAAPSEADDQQSIETEETANGNEN